MADNVEQERIEEMATKAVAAKKAEDACRGRHGPGYPSPWAAMKYGPREKLLYVITVNPNTDDPSGDYLTTIDADPSSSTYSQVIHRTYTKEKGNELHHSGWNACSSCFELKNADECEENIPKRNKLICPALNSNRIYVYDMSEDERKPTLDLTIDASVMLEHNVSAPHTTHCLADGTVMISTMGDAKGNAKGDFIQFDSNFNCLGTWVKGDKRPLCGYDFWYQPAFDVLISTEWSAPKLFKRGWQDEDVKHPEMGHSLNFFRYSDHTLIQTVDLGVEGITPLEVRFLHDPLKAIGFVGCALNSNLYRFHRPDESDEQFVVKKVVDIPNKVLEIDGARKEVGGMMADIIISLDDRWLYMNNWLHGDVRQYDISSEEPQLKAQLFLGGIANRKPNVRIVHDEELNYEPSPVYIKGKRLEGAPQMLQLSLDGKRLYVSSSLYSPWDKQFYPEMVEKGGYVVMIDVDTEKGGLKLNPDFFVDFGVEPNGPALPHEIRYPGGDCTSDIWLAPTKLCDSPEKTCR